MIETSVQSTVEATTETIRTTCAYCGVGCGVVAEVDAAARTIGISGDKEHPANYGRLCSKGNALGETLAFDRRIPYPTIHGQRTDWDTALQTVADRFTHCIEQYGANSVMFYVSGQLLTEDYYTANKLIKGFIGNNNIDSNSRLCMSSAVAGYKRAFGSDTVPCSYTDIEECDMFVITGSNMAWCHPVLFQRLKAAKERNPNQKVVVIDPRKTDSCAIADLHLPLKPGTDTYLFNGLLHYLAGNNPDSTDYVNAEYLQQCDGTVDACASATDNTLESVAQICDLVVADVQAFYALFAQTAKVVTFFSMGVNQSTNGTDKVNAIINCHLYTGKIGYTGAGPFSITGQPNAMGGREVGALANLLASHFNLPNAEHRATVANFWNAPAVIQDSDGFKAADVADRILDGSIKAIWIMATNPVVSLPEADKFAHALEQCEFVAVSDCSKDSDTTDYAHVLLPAQGWSEKDGTVTNSERRISRQRRLLQPFAEAKPDWWILSQVAQKMGFEGFDYTCSRDVFVEHAALSGYQNSGSRSFDISHLAQITAEEYDAMQPFQWGTQHFFGKDQFEQGARAYTPTGKVRMLPIQPHGAPNPPTAEYPLAMNTGRLRDQWHTMTRTAMAARLNQHRSTPFVSMHPADAEPRGLSDGDWAQVRNAQGNIVVQVRVSDAMRRGDVFAPKHWNNHFTANARVGKLIATHVDPISHQPAFKNSPVQVAKLHPVWQLTVLVRNAELSAANEPNVAENFVAKDDAVIHALRAASAELGQHQNAYTLYWTRNRQSHCTAYHATVLQEIGDAASDITDDASAIQDVLAECVAEMQEHLQKHWKIHSASHDADYSLDTISFNDDAQHRRYAADFDGDCLQAVYYAAPYRADASWHIQWLDGCFAEPELDALSRAWILAGKPAEGYVDEGRTICSCFTVGENTIIQTIQEHQCATAADVTRHCKAGGNCGSCIPEIQQLLQSTPLTVEAKAEAVS